MGNHIEMRKLEQYAFKLDLYEVVLEYVESADMPLHMDVTIHKAGSSGMLVIKSRSDLNELITLLREAASLDDKKKEEY